MSRHTHPTKHDEATHVTDEAAPPADAAAPAPAAQEPAAPAGIEGAAGAEGAASAGGSAPQPSELEAVRKELAAAKAELEDLNGKYLRKLADEVNFRKRMIREKDDAQKYAVASLLGDLVAILDDFDRGITSAETARNYDQLHEGVVMIRKQLSQMLENKYALKRFESKGTPFDPNRHEALFAEPGDVDEAVVTEEYLPGYSLHDRVLRTAKVRVRIPGPRSESQTVLHAEDSASGPRDAGESA